MINNLIFPFDNLKKNILFYSGKVTDILTSFKDATDIGLTIDDTMQKVMDIRESLLARIKNIRKGDEITCPEQNIKQEQKLSEFRQEIMGVLLKLVAADTATTADMST